MKIDYIRREVSSSISEDGGGYIQLVNKNTVWLTESIAEAINNLYINGQATTVKAYFEGLFRSMIAGIKADGHPRQLGGLITVYPTCGGTFDLDTGWDPLVNDVRINARLLNEIDIDVKNWTLNDVTPGKVSFTLDSICGVSLGVVGTQTATAINGKNLPDHDKLRLSYTCGDKVDVAIPSTGFGSTLTRVDIPASSLSAIASSAYDGKEITFILRGCYTTVKIKGVVKYQAPTPILTGGKQGERADWTFKFGATEDLVATGSGLTLATGDKVWLEADYGEATYNVDVTDKVKSTSTATSLVVGTFENTSQLTTENWCNADVMLKVQTQGGTAVHECTIVTA